MADTLDLQVMSPKLPNPTTLSLEELSWTEILGLIYSQEELSLTRILGHIRYLMKEFWEMTVKILSQKIRRKLEKLVSTCPASNQGYTPITIQLKALQTRILKMENYEKKAGLTAACTWARRKLWFFSETHSFRETRSKNNTEERDKCTTYTS